jgi:hypothetical protein
MKMHRFPLLTVLVLTALAPVCAFAQEVGGTDILVTGERLEPAAIRDAVRDMASERFDEPLVRFHDPVCLSVSGLGRVGSAQVRDRLLTNARAAGALVAEEGCRANALVLVVDDPAALVVRIEEKQPRLISPAERGRLDAALARGETVLVWHNEETRAAEGHALGISATVPGMPVTGPGSELGAETRVNSQARARRAGATNSRAVVNGVVILDIEHLVGMDLERVADFATMRLLAPGMRAAPDAGDERETGNPQSILAPFAAGRGAERLTRFDRAWLSALYDLAPNAASTRLAGAVARAYASEGG